METFTKKNDINKTYIEKIENSADNFFKFQSSISKLPLAKKTKVNFETPLTNKIKVNIHYSRIGNDLDGWNMWYWNQGNKGSSVDFTQRDDFGKIASFEVDKDVKEISFLLRKNNWEDRDVNVDRKIDISKVKENGELDIYLLQNETKIFYNPTDMSKVKVPEIDKSKEFGVNFLENEITLKVFAPYTNKSDLVIYENGLGGTPIKEIPMNRAENGAWNVVIPKDLEGKYYTFKVNGREAVDPYAYAVGANGVRAQIVDISKINPKDWENDKRPEIKNASDSIIYELHVRNFTIDGSSGVSEKNRGKYTSFTEVGTKNSAGLSTGMDHLKELGVSHVQIMPVYDFGSIDETKDNNGSSNWGYDPVNWNVPEGSYSTNAFEGKQRIKEFKEMVKAFHDNKIRVIMDVVYPHTQKREDSNLNILAPDYYYRKKSDGNYANGSGCGNEIASEKAMARKLIVDSVVHWAKDYHIDGFRFDQMSLIDKDTMKEIRNELNKIDKNILMYGEGWDKSHTLPEDRGTSRSNISDLKGIGFFNNEFSNAIRGDFNGNGDKGFVHGNESKGDRATYGIKADVTNSSTPDQMINYVGCHDNLTYWDNLNKTLNASYEDKIRTYKLGYATVLTSQGIPFISEGDEFLRPKNGNHNSYNSGDSVNKIDWQNKSYHKDVNDYMKGLIELRREHPAFRIPTSNEIFNKVSVSGNNWNKTIEYTINGNANGDKFRKFEVLINYSSNDQTVQVSENNKWTVLVNDNKSGTKSLGTIEGNSVRVPAHSMIVLTDFESYKKFEIEKINEKMLFSKSFRREKIY